MINSIILFEAQHESRRVASMTLDFAEPQTTTIRAINKVIGAFNEMGKKESSPYIKKPVCCDKNREYPHHPFCPLCGKKYSVEAVYDDEDVRQLAAEAFQEMMGASYDLAATQLTILEQHGLTSAYDGPSAGLCMVVNAFDQILELGLTGIAGITDGLFWSSSWVHVIEVRSFALQEYPPAGEVIEGARGI